MENHGFPNHLYMGHVPARCLITRVTHKALKIIQGIISIRICGMWQAPKEPQVRAHNDFATLIGDAP